jgi:hypothetical protein
MSNENDQNKAGELTHQEKQRLFMTLDLHTRQNENIERALYGDEKNGQKGVIHIVGDHEKWIKGMDKKMLMLLGGVLTIMGAGHLWEWVHAVTK